MDIWRLFVSKWLETDVVTYCSLSVACVSASLLFRGEKLLGSGWMGSYHSYQLCFTLATVAVSVLPLVVGIIFMSV